MEEQDHWATEEVFTGCTRLWVRAHACHRRWLAILSIVLSAGLSDKTAAQTGSITFADFNLEMIVRAVLGKPGGALTDADMLTLTNLIACRRAITSLSDLTKATNLRYLDVSGNSISDLSPLSGLTNLVDLNAGGNKIQDPSPLAGLTNLAGLWLYENRIGSLNAISNLNHLSSLILFNCNLNDVSPVAALTNLKCLDLRWNSIARDALASVCTNLTALTSLHLGGYPMTNMSFLQPLTRLTFLDVQYTGISDLSTLTALTNLNYLVLSGNPGITNYPVLSGLTGLVNLELRSSSISNLTFVSSLTNLRCADLAYNSITNLSPLGALANLNTVNLSGNPGLDYAPGMASLMHRVTSLWLSQNSISNNVSFLTNMTQLTGLGLDDNLIGDPSPLIALTNLQYMGLSRNPVVNYGVLAGFTNLMSFYLEGNSFSNLRFATNLVALRNLSVRDNRLRNLTDISRLTNLTALYAGYNRLTNVSTLTNLFAAIKPPPYLSRVELSHNLLDLSAGSPTRSVVLGLQSRGVEVDYLPTNQPPTLTISARWYIAANQTSSLSFNVSDALVSPGELTLTATSTNTILLPNSSITLGAGGSNFNRSITVTPAPNQTDTENITVTASQPPGGLSGSTNILTTVMFPTNVVLADANLANIVLSTLTATLGQPVTNLTSVGMMYLTSLNTYNASISDLSGLEWASNLTALYLGSNTISNTAPLRKLGNLAYLDLSWNPVTNWVPLSVISNLATLDLTGDSVTDLSFLANHTQLTTLYLGGNLLTNINALQTLPALSYVDLSNNLLDIRPGSAALSVITNLWGRGVIVVCLPQTLDGRSLGSPNLPWQTGGDAMWLRQATFTHGGYPAAQSGAIADSQASWLQSAVTGPGKLTFWWKVSSETNYDWFSFSVANSTNQISGEVDWQQQIVNVPTGPQTLIWRYSKDQATSSGLDAAWLGQVTFVPGIWLELVGGITNHQSDLLLHAVPGEFYAIMASTNLVDWWNLTALVPTNTSTPFHDAGASTQARFYRLGSLSLSSIWIDSLGWTNGRFHFILHSPPNLRFAVQSSASLTNWTTLGNVTNTLGTLVYTDARSPGFGFQFYRAKLLP